MSTGSNSPATNAPTPIVSTTPDFSGLQAALTQFEADVTNQFALVLAYQAAETAATLAQTNANASIQAAQQALTAANQAVQAGAAQVQADQASIIAQLAASSTTPPDPNASPNS